MKNEEKQNLDNARKAAYFALRDVEENKAYSGIAVRNSIERNSPERPSFVRELVYGTLREQMYLDYIIGNFTKTPVSKLVAPDRVSLRMGIFQLLSLGSVPDYAAVSQTVEIAKRFGMRGHDKFINGVLREYLRDQGRASLPPREPGVSRYLSLKYSFAEWIVEMWLREFGDAEEVEKLLAALNGRPRFCIRVNTLKTDTESLAKGLAGLGFAVDGDTGIEDVLFLDEASGRKPLETDFYSQGHFSVQDMASRIAAGSVEAQPGETVVDVCAAPGGKAMAMAEAMKNSGRIIALDIHSHRIGLIEAEAARLGVDIVETRKHDSRETIPGLEGACDRVLVDAPCSGLGTARRKPEVKYKDQGETMESLPQMQLDILKASAGYVKPGGTLVYSTCTIGKRENQDVIDKFLAMDEDGDWACAAVSLPDRECFANVASASRKTGGGVQLLPTDGDTDGFFICKMIRAGREARPCCLEEGEDAE